MARKKLGEILIQAGVIDENQLRAALAEQARWGGPLGRILVDMRVISEEALVQALSHQLNFPAVKIDEKKIPQQALDLVPVEMCEQHGLIPFAVSGKFLDVAMADPTNLAVIDDLRVRTRLNVRAYLAGPKSIDRAIAMNYRGQSLPLRQPEAHIEGVPMLELEGTASQPSRAAPRRDPFGLAVGPLADTVHGTSSSGGVTGAAVPSVAPPPALANAPGVPMPTSAQGGSAPMFPTPTGLASTPQPVTGQQSGRGRAAGPPPTTLAPGLFDISPDGGAVPVPQPSAPSSVRLAPLVPESQVFDDLRRDIQMLQQRVQQLEALVARDEDVIRRLMGLLIQKGVCTREELLERLRQ